MLNREVTVSAERPTNGTDVLAGTGPGRAEPGRTEPGDSVVVRAVPSSARFGVQVGSAEGDEFSPQVGVLRRAESSAGPGQDRRVGGCARPAVFKADDLLHFVGAGCQAFSLHVSLESFSVLYWWNVKASMPSRFARRPGKESSNNSQSSAAHRRRIGPGMTGQRIDPPIEGATFIVTNADTGPRTARADCEPGLPVHVDLGGADVHGNHRRLRLQPGRRARVSGARGPALV